MRIMIIGASADRAKYGNRAVRAYLTRGDSVLPVNPKGQPIEGLRTYPSVAQVPGPIDRAVLYLHEDAALGALGDLAARSDVGEVWLSPGADSPVVVAEAERLKLPFVQACAIVAAGVDGED